MTRQVIARSEHFFITEEPHTCTRRCDHDEYRTSEDDNDEFWREDPEVLRWIAEANPEFILEPREDNPSYGHWEPSYLDWKQAHMCDECSEVCEDDEDEVMYRENGGQS